MGCDISKNAFMDTIIKIYTEKTNIEFCVSGGGAQKGIRLAANFGGSCRPQLRDLQGSIITQEDGVDMIHVAWDAIVFMVNKNNPVNNLIPKQVRDIFSGKARN